MNESIDYLTGKYEAYRLLLTSPRMNKPQRELITDLALDVKDRLEAAGVPFMDSHAVELECRERAREFEMTMRPALRPRQETL